MKDLRDFLEKAEKAGALLRVARETDPLTEMGVLFGETEHPLLFERVRGYPDWQVCGELVTTRASQALALHVDAAQVVAELARRMQQGTVPGRVVATGPVKERVLTGLDVDLRALPVVVHSQEDGGPYIGSGMCVTKDPDTGIQNVAMLRLQIQDRARTGTAFAPRHSWMHYRKYEARGEPMPMAVVIGHHPLLDVATNSSVPYGVDEFQVAGALLGEPVEMVPCETVDLLVPAHAEIVIEGVVPPGVREEEGPFGEFQCYYLTRKRQCPVFEVRAVTMRRDALYRHVQATPSTVEHQALVSLPMEAHLWQRIRDVDGFIDLKDIHVPPWGACFLVLIKFTPHLEEQAKSVLLAALSSSYVHPKIAIALDDDIDLTDPRDVFWAVATRVDPSRDLIQVPHARIHPLDPSGRLVTAPGAGHQRVGGKLGIDATKPPTCRPKDREEFERVRPMGYGRIALQEVLGALAGLGGSR
ncbi:MAG: UbiD family decarboxylase [Deltaproteobacteria bacterium]|nr:UbiD family decarboxylase [Deltaproteobacteria bacterium]MBI3075837.1 UbiD family decarboxylase [Deltaproteobacteria bacterium]